MALTALFAAAANRASTAVRSAGQSVALYGVIGLLGVTGAGFLVAALYIGLSQATTPLAAAILMGTGFLAIAGIILAVVIARGKRKKREHQRAAANTAMAASTISLATTAIRLVSRVRGPMLVPAALAALAAGWYLSSMNDGDDD